MGGFTAKEGGITTRMRMGPEKSAPRMLPGPSSEPIACHQMAPPGQSPPAHTIGAASPRMGFGESQGGLTQGGVFRIC
eukprot:4098986-Pyramimonas_sp.AAC.1